MTYGRKWLRRWGRQLKTRRLEVRLTPALYDVLARMAAERGMTRTAVLEELIMALALGVVRISRRPDTPRGHRRGRERT